MASAFLSLLGRGAMAALPRIGTGLVNIGSRFAGSTIGKSIGAFGE